MCVVFFFFKQKTAYEMRISDWSSDVCSSDLGYAIGQIVSNVATNATDIFQGLDVTQLGNVVGAFIGNELGAAVGNWDEIGEQLGSSIGGSLGAIAGTAIPIPVIGSIIGAFFGNLLGGQIGRAHV